MNGQKKRLIKLVRNLIHQSEQLRKTIKSLEYVTAHNPQMAFLKRSLFRRRRDLRENQMFIEAIREMLEAES